MSTAGPDPRAGGGCYLFVANGTLEMQGKTLPTSSVVFVDPGEDAFEIKAGRNGLEALVMQFPRDDE
jgi:redox-sensitive bicupin YhaK (pirin superfamily)